MRSGRQKTCNTDNLVGAQRDRAHSIRDLAGKPSARARRGEIAIKDRLALSERKEDLATDHLYCLRGSACNGTGAWPRDQLRVIRFPHLAGLKVTGRGDIDRKSTRLNSSHLG